MKLTSKGRYAVMALVDLARFDSINPVSLRDISLRQGISLDYLEQIFSKLKKNQMKLNLQIFFMRSMKKLKLSSVRKSQKKDAMAKLLSVLLTIFGMN